MIVLVLIKQILNIIYIIGKLFLYNYNSKLKYNIILIECMLYLFKYQFLIS